MTDEELKDLVAGLAVSNKETSELLKEFRLSMEELGRKQEETWKVVEELGRKQEETDRQIKALGAQIGGVSNNYGFHAEQFFQDVFERKKVFGGIKYDEVRSNFGRNDDVKIEIDIALFNGESVALIEVKNRIHPNFVTELAEERVKKFRSAYPKYDNYKIYLGIAGFSYDEKAMERAKEYGVGILKQTGGDSVEVEADCLKAY